MPHSPVLDAGGDLLRPCESAGRSLTLLKNPNAAWDQPAISDIRR
jgi:hypothetical protein